MLGALYCVLLFLQLFLQYNGLCEQELACAVLMPVRSKMHRKKMPRMT